MALHPPTRAEDELHLRALALRDQGVSHGEIAARLGGTRSQWLGLLRRIRLADQAHDAFDYFTKGDQDGT